MQLSIVGHRQTPAEGTQSDAFANAVDLARRAEALGYKRSASVASLAPRS